MHFDQLKYLEQGLQIESKFLLGSQLGEDGRRARALAAADISVAARTHVSPDHASSGQTLVYAASYHTWIPCKLHRVVLEGVLDQAI